MTQNFNLKNPFFYFQRYKAIMDPFGPKTSKTFAKLVIVFIWLFGSILAIPNAIFHKYDFVFDATGNGIKPFCTPEELSHSILNYHPETQTYNETFFNSDNTETSKRTGKILAFNCN